MDILLNKTSRAISVSGVLLVPGKPCKVDNAKELADKYPRLGQMVDSGEIVIQKPGKKSSQENTADSVITAEEAQVTPEDMGEPIAERRKELRRKKG